MYDVIIVGGGVSGTTLAFELSKYEGSVLLLEKENDVADGTTKANSAIIHAGYDAKEGTLMAKYNVWGNKVTPQLCKDLDVRVKNIGSLVVAFSEEEKPMLQTLYDRGVKNGVPDQRIIGKEELHEMEPNIADNAVAALYAPTACIVDPWDIAIACAETAVKNGAEVKLNEEVKAIQKVDDYFVVKTDTDTFEAKTVVNAAGVECDKVYGMVKKPDYEIVPNKGEYYLLDKSQGTLVNHVIFQCPTAAGKGVLVSPTVHGNLIVGPNSNPTVDGDYSTTLQGLADVKAASMKSVPSINFRENIRTFAGLRARRKDHGDFIIGEDPQVAGFYQIAAMQSPGLSSAYAIALDTTRMMQDKGLFTVAKENPVTTRKVYRFKEMSDEQRVAFIKEHPAYGRVICRCETITEGEIIDALHRPIVPVSIDGIKRRCNAGMGRCQGGFCGPRVQEIIARELGIPQEEVVKDKKGSKVLFGHTKEGGLQ